jgi:SEC-C motif-containing protein
MIEVSIPELAPDQPCPCNSQQLFKDCCQPLLQHDRQAETAELLMRSRYTAFVLEDVDYLRYSWHPDYCPQDIHTNDGCQWLGLKIKNKEAGAESDSEGRVHFVARYKRDGKATRIEENSRFERYQGRWVYVDGS